MTPDLYMSILAVVALILSPVGAFVVSRRMEGSVAPRHARMEWLWADDPWDEDTGLDRLEKYGPKGRLK